MFGFKDNDLEIINSIISRYSEVEKAILFGSRAKGNFKNGSDVDIVIEGDSVTYSIITSISSSLNEETCLPYKFDILFLKSITNKDLLEHIQRVGIEIYSK